MSPIAVGYSTPLGSALAPVVVAAYGLGRDASCILISRGLNDTYSVGVGDRSYVLRLYRARWRTVADVLFEVDALRHAAARGVPLAGPIPRVDGGWVTPVDAPEGQRLMVLFERVPGQEFVQTSDRERYVATYAANVARLHAAWDDFTSPHRRFALDLDHLLDAPAAALAPFLRDRPHDLAYVRALTAFLRESVEERGDALSWGVCHGDLHGGNAHLGDDGSVILFDFDCGGMGYRAYELAVFRWGTAAAWGKDADSFWALFVERYRAERSLRQADLDAVPVFVAIRQLWWMGLQAANADDWGSRRWLGDRSIDQHLMRTAHWCALHVPDAPVWECRPPLS